MRALLLYMFGAAVWILPGYLPRIVLRRTDLDKGTLPEERILGFALLALLSLLSLRFCGNAIWGAAFGTAATWASVVAAWNRGIVAWPRPGWSWPSLIKILFFLTIAAIYLPLITGWRMEYRLPEIYDLPKHLAAVSSIAHATRWPAPNPFAPTLSFAYNLLFYMPAGVLSKLAGWPNAPGEFFSISLLWVVWNLLGLLERVILILGGGPIHRLVAILFATVVSGYTGLLHPTDIPIGVNVNIWHLSRQWFDDPLTLFAYVPQHLFSAACVFAVPCFASWGALSAFQASIVASILLAGGILSSAILAPIFLAAAIPLLAFLAWPEKRPVRRALLFTAAGSLLIAISGVFILEYMSWAGAANGPRIKLVDANFLYTGLTLGPVALLALVGLVQRCFEPGGNRAWKLYAIICSFVACFWFGVWLPDMQLKTAATLRFLLIPLASWGFVWVWRRVSGQWLVRFAIAIAVFVLPATASLIEAAYFTSSAYIPRPPEERLLLEAVDRLPSGATVGVQQPDQFLAASLGGRLTVMDFRGYRDDAYLPASQRLQYAKIVDQLGLPDSAEMIDLPKSADALIATSGASSLALWTSVCGTNAKMAGPAYLLVDLKSCAQGGGRRLRFTPVLALQAMNWERWGTQVTGSQSDPVSRTVSSPTAVDLGLISPVLLIPGVYRLHANISGTITGLAEGAGHISLHGKQKVINIQSGDYQSAKDFTAYISIDTAFQGYIAFGLGGWSRGAGWIRLNALTIERISTE